MGYETNQIWPMPRLPSLLVRSRIRQWGSRLWLLLGKSYIGSLVLVGQPGVKSNFKPRTVDPGVPSGHLDLIKALRGDAALRGLVTAEPQRHDLLQPQCTA